MKSRSEALAWAHAQVGKSLDMDGKWGAQCVDLVGYYYEFLTGRKFQYVTGAVDLWYRKWPQDFIVDDSPETGDIVVFAGSQTNQHGHCAIFVERISNTKFRSVDQNWFNFNADKGSPTAYVEHVFNGVLGYIRPRFSADAPPASKPVAAVPAGVKTYTIQPNDTFWGLEVRYNWQHGVLQSLNPNLDPRTLQIGQQIFVPASANVPQSAEPRKYSIVRGDTFWDLERYYKWPHGTLQSMNPGVNPRMLQIGQQINIPG